MVATAQVISSGAAHVAHYFAGGGGGGSSEYYATESSGVWYGGALAALGLAGEVKRADLEKLLAGLHPSGHRLRPMRRYQRDKNRPQHGPLGIDITFSVPKSESTMYAAADEAKRRELVAAKLAAIKPLIDFMESDLELVRKGPAGTIRERGKIAVAMFCHFENRDHEPQLHVHCVIPNHVLTSDGKWQAINTRELLNWVPTLGRMFRCNLARELTQRLGVELYIPEDEHGKLADSFEIKGIPRSLMDHWSSRRKAIEREIAITGDTSSRAKQKANLKTRKAKIKISTSQLQAEWTADARKHGLTPEAVDKLCDDRRKKICPQQSYESVIKSVLKELTYHDAYFTERLFIQKVCQAVQHLGYSGTEMAKRIRADIDKRPDLIPLTPTAYDRVFTSLEMWQVEERLIKNIQEMADVSGATVSARKAEAAIRRKQMLSPNQADAARYLLTTKRSIRVLTGVAGAGKSFLLDVVRDAYERQGFRVIGGAIAGVAAQELAQKTSIKSRTIASYLYHLDRSVWDKVSDKVIHDLKMLLRQAMGFPTFKYRPFIKLDGNTVVVIDEAAMCDSRSFERLSSLVKKASATLILCGDDSQLPPVCAGNPFAHAIRVLGSCHLTENLRQRDPHDKTAVADIREKKITKAVHNYAARERVVTATSREKLFDKLIADWSSSGGVDKPKDHMILSQTRADAAYLNECCQQLRRDTRKRNKSFLLGKQQYFVGDRILFHKAQRQFGIENGHFGTITGVTALGRVRVTMDHASPFHPKESHRVVLRRSVLLAGQVTLGYAATTHKLQGTSQVHTYVLTGKMDSHEMGYVQATRGAQSTRFYVPKSRKQSEVDRLIQSMSRSTGKSLAHDIGKAKSPDHDKSQLATPQQVQEHNR